MLVADDPGPAVHLEQRRTQGVVGRHVPRAVCTSSFRTRPPTRAKGTSRRAPDRPPGPGVVDHTDLLQHRLRRARRRSRPDDGDGEEDPAEHRQPETHPSGPVIEGAGPDQHAGEHQLDRDGEPRQLDGQPRGQEARQEEPDVAADGEERVGHERQREDAQGEEQPRHGCQSARAPCQSRGPHRRNGGAGVNGRQSGTRPHGRRDGRRIGRPSSPSSSAPRSSPVC